MDTLLLEIGSEEIPAGYIKPALEALALSLQQKLADRNYMITGYQVKVDPAMSRIPLIHIIRPVYDDLLRRIDHEV